jgi:hypothetical protein
MTFSVGLQAEDSVHRFFIDARKTWPVTQHRRLHWPTVARPAVRRDGHCVGKQISPMVAAPIIVPLMGSAQRAERTVP